MKKNMKSKGFTLVEILVVVSIIGILAAILVPVVARSKTKAKIAMAKVQMNDLAVAIKSYKSDYQRYPLPSFTRQSRLGMNAGKDASFAGPPLVEVLVFYSGSPYFKQSGFVQDLSTDRTKLLLSREGGIPNATFDVPVKHVEGPVYLGANEQTKIVSILWDRNNDRNPKKNVYLNVKESGEYSSVRQPGKSKDGYYLDPFGNAYNISVDKNADGYCVDEVYAEMPSGAADVGMVPVPDIVDDRGVKVDVRGVKGSDVLIWTEGPDFKASAGQGAILGSNTDNILSWK